PIQQLFHTSHLLRHPDSIYRISLAKVGDAYCKVAETCLQKMDQFREFTGSGFEINELLAHQEHLLRCLQEHLEDCWLTLKTLVDPKNGTKDELFADRYVIKSGLPGAKTFSAAIADYKRSLRIANKLKHEQGRLRPVAMWFPGSVHLGYFLEGPNAQGQLGPSPEIHPDGGAISFARDLGWHIFNIYRISEKLVDAVQGALEAQGVKVKIKARADSSWDRPLSLAVQIPDAYFKKDVQKRVATIRIGGEPRKLTVSFPENVWTVFPATVKTACSYVIDGHNPTYKVPLP
ncbi:MAG: hypothetical protein WAM68_06910, partial [Acidobacteriaceae bacterium]